MNKSQLLEKIAEDTGVSKKVAGEVLDALTNTITEVLARQESVTLIGFGTFKTTAVSARTGRNPQTGAPIEIAAKTVPRFTPGASLKEAVNK